MKSALTYVSAIALALGLGAAPAMAQSDAETDAETTTQAGAASGTSGTAETAQTGEATTDTGSQAAQAQSGDAQAENDRIIATVGDEEIRQSDVVTEIEGLPEGVRQTPPQMLLPAVVDQLIMRHLIVEEARAEGLEQDSEVQALVDAESATAMEQALVNVWLKRKLDERVTDAAVEKAVEELAAQNPDMGDTPTIVPQVRQALQVQAMTDISDELRSDAEITFYDPSGKPIDPAAQVGSGTEGESAPETQSQN